MVQTILKNVSHEDITENAPVKTGYGDIKALKIVLLGDSKEREMLNVLEVTPYRR